MSEILQARVKQKTDTLANWLANPLVLLAGEQAFVKSDLDDTAIGFKIGDGTKTFSDLPFPDFTVKGRANTSSTFNPATPVGIYIPTENGSYGGITVALSDGYQVLFWDGTTLVKVVYPIDLAPLNLLTTLSKLNWKFYNAAFSTDEKNQIIKAIKDVVIRTVDGSSKYGLNYIQKGTSSLSSLVSISVLGTGNSFAFDAGVGVPSGIQVYNIPSTFTTDVVTITIDWDIVTLSGSHITMNSTRNEFAESAYSIALRPVPFGFENPYTTFTAAEQSIVNGIIDVYVRLKSPNYIDYSVRYVAKGSASVTTKISIAYGDFTNSFSTDFGLGIPTGVVTYKCIDTVTNNEIYIVIDWSKTTIANGVQINMSTNGKAKLSKGRYVLISDYRYNFLKNIADTYTPADSGLLKGIVDISVKTNSETYTQYALRYVTRPSASVALVISFYVGTGGTSAGTSGPAYSVGVVSGVQDYTWVAPNGDLILLTLNWDKTDLAAGETRELPVQKAILSKMLYSITGNFPSIRSTLFKNDYSINASEVRVFRGFVDMWVKSKSETLTMYALRYVIRPSASATGTFSFFYDSNATSKPLDTPIPIGVVSGTQEYVWIANNGDEIHLTFNWDATDIAAAERIDITYPRGELSKRIYYVAASSENYPTTIELLTPDILPVAKNVELIVYSENLRNLSNFDERSSRVDMQGGNYTVPRSDYTQPWRYQFTGSVPANFVLTVYNKRFSGTLINSANISVRPVSDVFNATTALTEMLLGDSNIDISNAVIPRTYKALIQSHGSYIPTLIGTRSGTSGGVTVNHEGHPGSTARDYTTSATLPIGSGATVTNPFWDGTKFNFSFYMSAQGYVKCDHLMIMLGANDIYLIATSVETVADYIAQLKTMITSAWAYNPLMKITVCQPNMGDMSQDGGSQIKTLMVPLNKAIKAAFAGDIYKSASNVPVRIANVYLCIDRVQGYRTADPLSPTGVGYPFDYTHVNLNQYAGICDILFSQRLYDLNT